MRSSEPDTRLRFAERSYEEVLDATKHQDDKIGRFLTAIAFLFTGSVALLARSGLIDVRVTMDGSRRALPALFLGLFLTFSALAVLLLVVALGPNLNLPRGQRRPGSSGSRLFFLSIASKTEGDWQLLWRPGTVTREAMTKTFVEEAHNLAFKTEFKYSRTNEARALFTLGLLFLALAVVLYLDASTRADSTLDVLPALAWDLQVRLWVALVTATSAFILAYDYVRLDQEPDNYLEPGKRLARVWPNWGLAIAAPIFVSALLLPVSFSARLVGLVLATFCLATTVAAVALRQAGRTSFTWQVSYVGVAILWVSTVVALLSGEATLQLSVALLAVIALEGPRILVASRSHQRRLETIRDRRPHGIRREWQAWRKLRKKNLNLKRANRGGTANV